MPAVTPNITGIRPNPNFEDFPNNLTQEEKALATVFVLTQDGIDVPKPMSFRQIGRAGVDDVKKAVQRIRNGEPHRFANLFGSIGGTVGALAGRAVGAPLSDKATWGVILAGAALGTYPPALAGYVVDQLIDRK